MYSRWTQSWRESLILFADEPEPRTHNDGGERRRELFVWSGLWILRRLVDLGLGDILL